MHHRAARARHQAVAPRVSEGAGRTSPMLAASLHPPNRAAMNRGLQSFSVSEVSIHPALRFNTVLVELPVPLARHTTTLHRDAKACATSRDLVHQGQLVSRRYVASQSNMLKCATQVLWQPRK